MDDINLKNELTLLLEREVGFTGKFILEKQCENLKIDPNNISCNDLEPLSGKVTWAIKNYTGEKRAEEIRKGILEYRQAMDVVRRATVSNFNDLKNFTFKHLIEADMTIAINKLDLGLHDESIAVLKNARELLNKASPEDAKALKPRIGRLMGRALSESATTFDDALEEFYNSISLGLESGGYYDVALSWNGIGSISWRTGKHEEALGFYKKALTALISMPAQSKGEKKKKKSAMALIKSGIGNVCLDMRDYDFSIKQNEEAIELFASVGDDAEVGRVFNNLARAYEEKGDYTQAIEHYRTAILHCIESGSIRLQGWALTNMAGAMIDAGKADEAREHLEKAERILGNFSDPVAYSKVNCMWGKYHRERAEWSDGIERFQKSIDVVMNAKAPDYLAIAREEFGTLYLKKGEGDRARALLQQALDWSVEKNDRVRIPILQDMIHRSAGFSEGLI